MGMTGIIWSLRNSWKVCVESKTFLRTDTSAASRLSRQRQQQQQQQQVRFHYQYKDPGHASLVLDLTEYWKDRDFSKRGFTVGIGGPVGSGKTATTLALCRAISSSSAKKNVLLPMGVVTNDIFTQEDAEYLVRQKALPADCIRAVETGGCPHAAIREDISANLTALEQLTKHLNNKHNNSSNNHNTSGGSSVVPLLICESGGDNLAANFSRELADLILYVIDVAGGDKIPRKGGPGITQSDLLIINKIDLAEAVGADLKLMEEQAHFMRRRQQHDNKPEHQSHAPVIMASIKHKQGLQEIVDICLSNYHVAMHAANHHHHHHHEDPSSR